MIQTKATGHAGNKRRSDSAVAQQLTPANTRKRAAKTKRLNLFCSIISKQNEVSKTIQINSLLQIYIFSYPPQFYKHLFQNKPVYHVIFTFHSTIRESKLANNFTKRTVPPAIFPPTNNTRPHFFAPLLSFIYKIHPQPLHSLNNHYQPSPITAPSRENNRRSKSIQPSYPYFLTPQTTILHILKRKTKIKAPDIENGHTATASRIILKNEKHVPRVSYSYIDIYVGKKPRPSPIMRKKT